MNHGTHDKKGRELNSGISEVINLNELRPPSLEELVRRAIRTELSQRAAEAGDETFEEADDFDVDDDIELKSPYELTDLPPDPDIFPTEPPKKQPQGVKQSPEAVEAPSVKKKPAKSKKTPVPPPTEAEIEPEAEE